jgi:Protein of unknown function (DUF4242)
MERMVPSSGLQYFICGYRAAGAAAPQWQNNPFTLSLMPSGVGAGRGQHCGSLNTTKDIGTMKQFVIERDIPGVGKMDREQYKDVAATSNKALARLAGKAQWVQTFVVDEKTFCIYLAENEAAVQEHARLSGFPASKVTEVRRVIGPMSAIY